MDDNNTRDATIDDYVEQGKSNGMKSAGYLLQHCFGSPNVEQMSVESWWKVHEEKIEPEVLAKLKKSGASQRELNAFLESWRSELNWCSLTYASLGLMKLPPEIYDIDSRTDVHRFEPENLHPDSSLEECSWAGNRCGTSDARISSLIGLYRGYDYATAELGKIIEWRVRNLVVAGLNETQRLHFTEAAQAAGPIFLGEVERRWSELQET